MKYYRVDFQTKNKLKFNVKNINNLEKITNIFFSNKRKMINKNLRKILGSKKIKSIHSLDMNLRPQDLSPDLYYKITQLFEK